MPFMYGDLVSLGVSPDLATQICNFLEQSVDELDQSRPPDVPDGAFGAAPASLGCASDAGKARQHVHDAISDMMTGLRGYRTTVEKFKRDTDVADETAEADMLVLVQASESCTTPTFADASGECGVPGTEGSGG